MAIIEDKMRDRITLHGLGFVQVQLEAEQRLHVWHPDLPRRACFEHSAIHDHRFDFVSQVLVGVQRNIEYRVSYRPDGGDYVMYLHEGARLPCGGRPWVLDGRCDLTVVSDELIPAGKSYSQQAYFYHRTEPQGDGRVATVMRKLWEGEAGAHSTCRFGVQPDAEFDRYQWSPSRLWEVVADVLGGAVIDKL